jgi:hypothetical protein
MTTVDRYREQARAEFFADVEAGTDPRVTRPLDELGGRTLHEVWTAGDHASVERWLDDAYARAEASAEAHRNDPEFVAMIERRRTEIARNRKVRRPA